MEVGSPDLFSGGSGRFFFKFDRGVLFIYLAAKGSAGALHGGEVAAAAALGGLAQVGDCLIRILFGFCENVSGVLVGLLKQFFPPLLKLFFLVLEDLAVLFERGSHTCGFLLLGPELLSCSLEVGEEILKVLSLLAELLLCGLDDIIGQSKLLGDREGITLSGDADHEPVSGLQSFHVEFAAGIHNALRAHGIGL